MNPPHNKIHGRTFTDKPAVGIPLALDILATPESHRNDVLSAVCYLGYRILDGTYKDVDYILPKIEDAKNTAKQITYPDEPWFRTRWVVSLTVLSIYFDMLVLNKPLPVDSILEILDRDHIERHPPQFVNIIKANTLLIEHHLIRGDRESALKYIEFGVEVFRSAVKNYKIENQIVPFSYESAEASECLCLANQMLEFSSTGKLILKEQDVLRWTGLSKQQSRGSVYKCLLKEYYEKVV